jgi:hypothetical protein
MKSILAGRGVMGSRDLLMSLDMMQCIQCTLSAGSFRGQNSEQLAASGVEAGSR